MYVASFIFVTGGFDLYCSGMPLVSLSIIRYKKRFIPFAILAMAIHHIPLWFNKRISFYKLMGSGKNGTFDKRPDWQQWALLCVLKPDEKIDTSYPAYGSLIKNWYRLFGCEIFTMLLDPIEGQGLWDGKKVFGELKPKSDYAGEIAILTRATIRLNKLKYFWRNVAPVASKMNTADGFLFSAGIGEVPWIKQATFSIWKDKASMMNFAYGMKEHAEVIQKTRKQQWYSEDMFVRFRIVECWGTIRNENPLAR